MGKWDSLQKKGYDMQGDEKTRGPGACVHRE